MMLTQERRNRLAARRRDRAEQLICPLCIPDREDCADCAPDLYELLAASRAALDEFIALATTGPS